MIGLRSPYVIPIRETQRMIDGAGLPLGTRVFYTLEIFPSQVSFLLIQGDIFDQ